MGALNLLRDITAFVTATKQPSSADRPIRLAVVDAGYAGGWPKVTFEGEATLSGKQYAHVDSYAPAAGDRVVMVPVGTTYLIVGAVSTSGAGQPAGAIQPYAGAAAPSGWLLCDGAAVSRTTYSRLFAAIGTAWGTGNGTTTFNVPDLRGRAPIGVGTGTGLTARALAATGGAETVALAAGDLPSHTHPLSGSLTTDTEPAHTHTLSGSTSSDSHSHTVSNQGGRSDLLAGGGTSAATSGSGSTGSDAHTHTLSGSAAGAGSHSHAVTLSGATGATGTGTAHANMQPWAAVLMIIKT